MTALPQVTVREPPSAVSSVTVRAAGSIALTVAVATSPTANAPGSSALTMPGSTSIVAAKVAISDKNLGHLMDALLFPGGWFVFGASAPGSHPAEIGCSN